MEMVVGVSNSGVEMITVGDENLSWNSWLDDPLAPPPLLLTSNISEAPEVVEAGVEAVAANDVIAAQAASVTGPPQTLRSGRQRGAVTVARGAVTVSRGAVTAVARLVTKNGVSNLAAGQTR